jgi:hypothetical protein
VQGIWLYTEMRLTDSRSQDAGATAINWMIEGRALLGGRQSGTGFRLKLMRSLKSGGLSILTTYNIPQNGSGTFGYNQTPLVAFVIPCEHHLTISHVV